MTVLVYIYARVKWRQELKEKERLFKMEEEAQLKEAQAWEQFLNENQQTSSKREGLRKQKNRSVQEGTATVYNVKEKKA